MLKEKIVFLDLDGVINDCSGFDEATGEVLIGYTVHKIGPYTLPVKDSALVNLKLLLDFTGAKIVGISSWFETHDDEYNKRVLSFLGLEQYYSGVVWYTGGGQARGKAVLDYVYTRELENWIVIDDAGDNCYKFPTAIINGREGFTLMDSVICSWILDTFEHDLVSYIDKQWGKNEK